MSAPNDPLSLAHWRRTVAELYAAVRMAGDNDIVNAATRFRAARDRLFAEHPDSPIPAPARGSFHGARWFPYDRRWRTVGVVVPARSNTSFNIALSSDGVIHCVRVATVHFEIGARAAQLALYWFDLYGGGLWLPFSDATSGDATYGGGRYLYDTIKGADLGATGDRFVLDFNFAYNPSCAYDDRWSCPLSPAENSLAFAVDAGEAMPN